MAQRLPNDEWLHLAKGTAVGTQRRARHRSEGRDNLVVGNTPDRWWAYCQSCRKGAIEMKTHVVVGGPPPKDSTSLVYPTDARRIADLALHEREALTLQLAQKSMDWMYFGDAHVAWSASRQRLLISTGDGVMGRDTSGNSPQKWLTYDRQHYLKALSASRNVFLVEDTYSMYKLQYALNRSGIDGAAACTLGTAIHDSFFYSLLQYAAKVWSFYDGDSAGWRGAQTNAKRLAAVGLLGPGDVLSACAPHTKDPKDMQLGELAAHAARLLAT